MFTKRHWALLAAMLCVTMTLVQAAPVADDKADEMSMVAAMNMEEDIKPSTEIPKEEPIIEEPKPKELDTNHIQIIKMPSAEEAKEIIEELEEEIEREKEVEAEIKDHVKKEQEVTKAVEAKAETKEEPIVPVEIVKVAEVPETEMAKPTMERSPRNMQMEETSPKEKATQASSLSDDDIDKIMKMISFPQSDEVEKTENTKIETETKTEIKAEAEAGTEAIVQPRTTAAESTEEKTRVGRAIRNEGKGYYILAFSPLSEGPLVPAYTKLEIIPIERSVDGGLDVDDYDEDNQERLQSADSELEEGRVLTRKQFNKYIRKMMRQIRKGTRKIQRKTRLRSAVEEEPTVENFVRKWYATNKKAKAAAATPQRSWFSWGQKAE